MGTANRGRCPNFVTDYISTLRSRFNVQAVILFGSRAHGSDDQYSDWDLFVVASDLADWKKRVQDFWEDKPAGVDVIAWTPAEIRKHIYRDMILDIALHGIPLYGDAAWLHQLAEQYLAEHKVVQRVKTRA